MTIRVHLRANWASSVTETYEWLTTVFTTRSRKEQRTAERSTPRRSIKFAALFNGTERRNFEALLYVKEASTLQIPDFARTAAQTVSEYSAGTTLIYLTAWPAWIKNGIDVVLTSEGKSVFGTISAISSSAKRITLTSGLADTVEVGAEVRPVVDGTLPFTTDISAFTSSGAEDSLEFRVAVGAPMPTFGEPALPLFETRTVLTVGPNWQSPMSISFGSDVETVDYGRGIRIDHSNTSIVSRITQLNYFGRGVDDIGQVVGLHGAMRGRQGEFWCPTWTDDMIVSANIAAGATTIRVEGRQLADVYAASTTNKAIAIRLSDETWLFRRITAITVNGANPGQFSGDYSSAYSSGESIVAVSEPFTQLIYAPTDYSQLFFGESVPNDIGRLEVVAVYWLHLCRFASDQLVVQWMTDGVGQLVIGVQALEYNDVEI